MKLKVQVKNLSVSPSDHYQFVFDVDTKLGIEKYLMSVPPVEGYKFDSVTKKFTKLGAMALKTAFDTYQANPTKWKAVGQSWPIYETPADDGLMPWPGPLV